MAASYARLPKECSSFEDHTTSTGSSDHHTLQLACGFTNSTWSDMVGEARLSREDSYRRSMDNHVGHPTLARLCPMTAIEAKEPAWAASCPAQQKALYKCKCLSQPPSITHSTSYQCSPVTPIFHTLCLFSVWGNPVSLDCGRLDRTTDSWARWPREMSSMALGLRVDKGKGQLLSGDPSRGWTLSREVGQLCQPRAFPSLSHHLRYLRTSRHLT